MGMKNDQSLKWRLIQDSHQALTFGAINHSLTLGDQTITEDDLRTLKCLFKVLESLPANNPLKQEFDLIRAQEILKNDQS